MPSEPKGEGGGIRCQWQTQFCRSLLVPSTLVLACQALCCAVRHESQPAVLAPTMLVDLRIWEGHDMGHP